MIDENYENNSNYIIDNPEMNAKIKKVEEYLENKLIFATKTWIKQRVQIHSSINKIEEKIYEEVLLNEISVYIDKNKVKSHFNPETNFRFETKQINKTGVNLFLQVSGFSNIAEPSEKSGKSGENLDELENFESKYLQGDEEDNKKAEKVVLKLQFTDGVAMMYGFEYEDLKEFKKKLNDLPAEVKFPKVIVGPNFEVRRGIIYLKNNNIKLLI